jgi:drug/metabolite transporter (DMT)-like permease
MPRSSPHVQLLLGVLAISFSATFVKLAPAVHPTVSAFYRTFYSSLILFVIAWARPESEWEPNNRRWLLPAIGAGLFLAADLIVWHKTIFFIGSGPATLLGNSQIIFVSLFALFGFKEKISPFYLLFVPVILGGLYLAVPKTQIMVAPAVGLGLGLVVGLTYAGFLICLQYAKARTGRGYPEIRSLAVIMAITAAAVGVYAARAENVSLQVSGWHDHGILLAMALIPQSLGWILIKSNLTRLPSHQGSLLLLIQPVLTTIWGCLLFQEPLTPLQGAGMIAALAALAVYQFKFASRA